MKNNKTALRISIGDYVLFKLGFITLPQRHSDGTWIGVAIACPMHNCEGIIGRGLNEDMFCSSSECNFKTTVNEFLGKEFGEMLLSQQQECHEHHEH